MNRAWIPTHREKTGIALALLLGSVSWVLSDLVAAHVPGLSSVVVAILVGALVINTRLASIIGLSSPESRDEDPYERGLRFTGKWLLRLAIILMGFKIQVELFEPDQVKTMGLILIFALPSTFLIIQAARHWLGLRRELGDLIAIGTMICGASAINALAPALVARRQEQGLAISVIFVFSIVALFSFTSLASMFGLSTENAGLWAGLAVNDLSSSIAVGSQFGPNAEVLATAAKSGRIILLGPLLIAFSLFRNRGTGISSQGMWGHFPKFILGYLLCFGLRILGDINFGVHEFWTTALIWNDRLVHLLLLAVCAGIGLQVEIKTLMQAGPRSLVTGAGGSFVITGLTLGMLVFMSQNDWTSAVLLGAAVLATTGMLYVLASKVRKPHQLVATRLERGQRISIREAITYLDFHDSTDQLTDARIETVMNRISPVIGEIQPLRTAPLTAPIAYRRLTYWESKNNLGSLVGIAWPPGSSAHIHTHANDCWSKTIEGELHVTNFTAVDEKRLQKGNVDILVPGSLSEMKQSDTLHALTNPGSKPAIHLHYYGPSIETAGIRYEPESGVQWEELDEGAVFEVDACDDILPSIRFEG